MPAIRGDIEELLRSSPRAADSFYAGHWDLMGRLEREATAVLSGNDLEKAIDFLVDVAFLKQPYRVDRQAVRERLNGCSDEIRSAIGALRRVHELDYRAMDVLANVPWFGRNGGRAFNSAVMRFVRSKSFGIIDWRNLAVIMGAEGFAGLVDPAVCFADLSCEEVLKERGHLILTQRMYEGYNDVLRALSRRHDRKVAEIDLAIWTYSIVQQPFRPTDGFRVPGAIVVSESDRRMFREGRHRGPAADRIVKNYLETLKDLGTLSRQRVTEELRNVFVLIRNECELFGRNKRGRVREIVNRVVSALDHATATPNQDRLLAQWTRWQDMVDPAAPIYAGISLPANMVLEGYLVFEDFLPVREYFEAQYDPNNLDPRFPQE